MHDTIVFDLGGVLIDWNPRYLYRKVFDNESNMETFLSTICTPDWNEQQDAGRPIAEAVEERTAQWPEHADLIRLYYDRWIEMVGGAFEETVDILEDLYQQDIPLYALTNWSAETFPLVLNDFPFFERFEGIVVSGNEKLKKPDPRLYRVLLDRYQLDPNKTVFIDDRASNVQAAEEMGMHGITYTSAPELRRELEALDLLP